MTVLSLFWMHEKVHSGMIYCVFFRGVGINILLRIVNGLWYKMAIFGCYLVASKWEIFSLSLRYPFDIPSITLRHPLDTVFYHIPLRYKETAFTFRE